MTTADDFYFMTVATGTSALGVAGVLFFLGEGGWYCFSFHYYFFCVFLFFL